MTKPTRAFLEVNSSQALAQAIAATAERWTDPAYPKRVEVIRQTLNLENRFTEEAMAFAANQQMALLRFEAIVSWLNGRQMQQPVTVGVLNAGNIPFVGLQDWLAVVLMGGRYRGVLSSRSPYFLPAFSEEVAAAYPDLDVAFVTYERLLETSEAVIASGGEDTMAQVGEDCKKKGIAKERCLLRGHRYAVAILTGNETPQEKEYLAEDVLLHEGQGCRNVAVIWAPEDLEPDAYLDAFALFRSVFPVHERTAGSLKMKQAFLNAIGASHAYGEGLEFLVSKGDPEPQEPGHVRWATYRTHEELVSWIQKHEDEIQLIVTGDKRIDSWKILPLVVPFGDAQRPELDWCADGIDTIAFLQSLS